MNTTFRNILLIIGAVILVAAGLAMVNLEPKNQLDLAGFATAVREDRVQEIVVRGNRMEVTMADGSMVFVDKESNISVPSSSPRTASARNRRARSRRQ